MAWRRHPECVCPSLPRAACAGFVELLDSLLPHLPAPAEGSSGRAHAELIEAIWMRIAPPASAPAVATPPSPPRGTADKPPVAQPLSAAPTRGGAGGLPALLASHSVVDGESLPPPPELPLHLTDPNEGVLERSTLDATRRVLLGTPMRAPLRIRLLQMPCAVVALAPRAAVERDACWREAAATMCLLSARARPAEVEILAEVAAAGTAPAAAAPATAPLAECAAGGANCAHLAAPLLVDAAVTALQGWSACADLDELAADEGVSRRASQLTHLISLLNVLHLPDGALPPPTLAAAPAAALPSSSHSVAPPPMAGRSGPRAHLLHLTPALIGCIGEPSSVFLVGGVGERPSPTLLPRLVELQGAIKRALLLASAEFQLA